MGIREHKITEKQIADYGLTSLPDLLTGTANENKTAMQQLLVLIGIPAINAVIDELGAIEDDTRNWGEAESLRVLQEAARAAAEAARQSAEQGRDTAEQARAAAEVLRQSAEQERAQAEQGRTDAETARQSAEQARVRAEDARSAAERGREQAEAARASAEQGRSAAEAARNVWEDYDGTRTYTPGNKVQHGGSSYVNIRACAGVTPPDSTYWQMIAAKGQSGDGSGDMLKSEYDPGGRNADIWAVRQIEDGGTGANNATDALVQLGAASAASVDAHTANRSNPHGVTAAQVGAATTAELNSHTARQDNPHGVTAAQVGAMPVAGGAFSGHVSMPSLALTNYGVPLEIGQMLDFHYPGLVADYNGRLYLGADGHLYWNNTLLSVPDAQKSVAYAASAGNANTLGGLPASSFYTAANAPVVVGTYTGDGASARLINLGFTPKAVLVMYKGMVSSVDTTAAYGGLAVAGSPACVDPRYGNYSVLVDTYGFVVYNSEASGGSARANLTVHYYNYIAFR